MTQVEFLYRQGSLARLLFRAPWPRPVSFIVQRSTRSSNHFASMTAGPAMSKRGQEIYSCSPFDLCNFSLCDASQDDSCWKQLCIINREAAGSMQLIAMCNMLILGEHIILKIRFASRTSSKEESTAMGHEVVFRHQLASSAKRSDYLVEAIGLQTPKDTRKAVIKFRCIGLHDQVIRAYKSFTRVTLVINDLTVTRPR